MVCKGCLHTKFTVMSKWLRVYKEQQTSLSDNTYDFKVGSTDLKRVEAYSSKHKGIQLRVAHDEQKGGINKIERIAGPTY